MSTESRRDETPPASAAVGQGGAAHGVIVLCAVAWVICVAISLVLLTSYRPGLLLQGMARGIDFLLWQAIAVVPALAGAVALFFVRAPRSVGARVMALAPLVLSVLIVLTAFFTPFFRMLGGAA